MARRTGVSVAWSDDLLAAMPRYSESNLTATCTFGVSEEPKRRRIQIRNGPPETAWTAMQTTFDPGVVGSNPTELSITTFD